MTEVSVLFRKLVSAVYSEFAKGAGFTKEGHSFRLKSGDSTALVEFQKSRDSTKERIRFTINLGVFSGAVGGERWIRKPNIDACHWSERIGFVLEDRRDKWWEIDAATSIEALTAEISECLEKHALPFLMKYLDDNNLRDLWLAGESPGLTDYERLKYLLALLKKIGPVDRIEETEKDFLLL